MAKRKKPRGMAEYQDKRRTDCSPSKFYNPVTEEEAAEMYKEYCKGASLSQIARDFKRSVQTVKKLEDKRMWAMKRAAMLERMEKAAEMSAEEELKESLRKLRRHEEVLHAEIETSLRATGGSGTLPHERVKMLIAVIEQKLHYLGFDRRAPTPPTQQINVQNAVILPAYDKMTNEELDESERKLRRVLDCQYHRKAVSKKQEGGDP